MSKKTNILLLVSSLAAGILSDWFFIHHYYGISVPLFILFLYSSFFLILGEKIRYRQKSAWLFAASTMLISLNFFLYENEGLQSINHLVVPFLFAVSLLLFTGHSLLSWYRAGMLIQVIQTAVEAVIGVKQPFAFLASLSFGKTGNHIFAAAKALLISLPVVGLVIALLIRADLKFRGFFQSWGQWFERIELGTHMLDLFVVAFIALATASFFFLLATRQPADDAPGKTWQNNSLVAITLLTMLVIVYGFFVAVQFAYLFGGDSGVFLETYTYAEYARKGFFELIGVGLINLAVALAIASMKPHQSRAVQSVQAGLLGCMIAFSFIILASAHMRLSLYEQAYGFTYDRVYAHLIIVLLAILFTFAFAALFYKRILLQREIVAASLCMLVVVNLLPLGQYIAQKNVNHYEQSGKIDFSYLSRLRADALPAVSILEQSGAQEEVKKLYDNMHARLEKDQYQGVPAFNLSRFKAKNIISER